MDSVNELMINNDKDTTITFEFPNDIMNQFRTNRTFIMVADGSNFDYKTFVGYVNQDQSTITFNIRKEDNNFCSNEFDSCNVILNIGNFLALDFVLRYV